MNRDYWQASRSPRYSLLFALPLLIFYQVLAAAVPAGPQGGVRNGADVLLQSVFIWLAGSWGPRLFMTCLIVVGVWLVVRDMRSHPGALRPGFFAGMSVESIGLALVFGVVVGGLTAALLGEPPPLSFALQGVTRLGSGTVLMLSLGAGIYEELLFRVVLVGLFAWLARRVLGFRPFIAGTSATIAGALVFSAFHYIGPFGDTWQVYSFVFRTIAGLFFSALYLTRGFGVTAWTHALYDVFLIMR